MDNALILAILGMMGLLALFFILLLFLFLRQKQGRPAGKQRQAPSEEAGRAPRQRFARVAVVWPQEGSPLLWSVDGKPFNHPDEVTDPEQRAALATFFEVLRREVPSPIAAPRSPLPKPRQAPAPQDRLSETDSPAPRPAPATPPAPQRPPRPRSYEEEMEQPLVERLKSSFLVGRTRPSPAETLDRLDQPVIPQLDELDQLLRARLAALPDAPTASIRRGSNGLLEIMVAGRSYERIDDVPQEDVRQAMREAIRAWEGGII